MYVYESECMCVCICVYEWEIYHKTGNFGSKFLNFCCD